MSEQEDARVDAAVAAASSVHEDASLPVTPTSRRIDAMLVALGSAVSWIWLLLLAVIVMNVTLRYLFAEGRIEFEELQWHLYSIGFLLGLPYAVATDSHIRVDVVHERLSPRLRAWIELYGLLLLFLPFCLLVLVYSVPFVMASHAADEVSNSAGGLAHRWLIKAVLPIAFALLILAGISRLTRVVRRLFGNGGGR